MDFMNKIFDLQASEPSSIYMILLALVISTLLSLVITKVYIITFTGERYAQSFVHTIIILSIIVSVVMNVVSDNAGVAFGLFAIFSLIRFRSAVTNVKDIAYIFFGLCAGMTCGLFRFDLAIILTLFACLVLYLLYKFEYGKGKDTQILKVTVPENLNYENLMHDLLAEYTLSSSLRQVETTNLGTMILYTYAIRMKNEVHDKELLDHIREKNANLKVSITYMENTDG
ncbi:DUF4956 domain-containing protein [Oceanobacillus oncorhynchi subsp. incaldanensis]|uniref:DUF4956 domain-containing protein n=2 Tax=Oceanobacillus TaxID=182709 RepID=A0A0A1MPW2_9BACI|nr:DUF4956 domain-containing protein [Oceanobacillus oncorhynchi]MDM8102707.1 DUF4956 domain-containing protein [Oceanobacillus oncorhynchi]UUI40340.1 DUF4956 domain-containing protein [Oceanobacillus oncorhynchi]GIO20627.1 DUF4956 domain-containing protein [Oceanobacillus oncorhynchi subsp. incaldanensis]CEI81769.1 hypothetical protein BN997_01622 [Oceanobacillus oncorhynchi]